jgi:cyclophilin family peptidyl-prolyl cis-trans isomerase
MNGILETAIRLLVKPGFQSPEPPPKSVKKDIICPLMTAKINCVTGIPVQYFLFFLLLGACSGNQPGETATNKYNDPVVLQIGEQKFNNWRTHLYNSLDFPNPSHKVEAILSFASLGDNTAFKKCAQLLKQDRDQTVRLASAFYLGEVGGGQSAKILGEALEKEQDPVVQKQILIALAKRVNISQVPLIRDFTSDNNLVREGQCLGLIILKNNFYSDLKFGAIAANYLQDPKSSESVRFLSSYFLSIADSVEIAPQENTIIQAIEKAQSPETTANLLVSLSILQKDSHAKIFEHYSASSDWIVRTGDLFGLRSNPSPERDHYFLNALHDSISRVQVTASEILKQNFKSFSSLNFIEEARKQAQWNVRVNLYEIAYLQSRNPQILQEVMDVYKNTSHPFEKSACIRLLGLRVENYDFLKNELFKNDNPMIRTACATAIVQMNKEPGKRRGLQDQFIEIYQQGLKQGDAVVITLFSQLATDPELKYYEKLKNPQILTDAYNALMKQKETEAAKAVDRVLSKIQMREPVSLDPKVKAPDWNIIKAIAKDQRILIKTSRGDIIVKLLVENAPVAVSNFLRLVDEKYYSNTYVFNVTNSYIQSGCSRGDGSSQNAYTLPYEPSIHAPQQPTLNITPISNGFHSTQWYILLNPFLNDVGKSIPIGVIETDPTLLRKLEKGDVVLSISRL